MISLLIPTTPIFAIGFSAPFLLWGLLFAGIPWLLHLLTKRHYRPTEWAAMRFLQAALRKNSRRIRLEQLILLLVRTLLIAIIVAALARPVWTGGALLFQGQPAAQRFLVIDATYSMGCESGGKTAFDRGLAIARQAVSESRAGDSWNLLRISQGESPTVIEQPSFRHDEVLGELDRLRLTSGTGTLLPALKSVEALIQKHPEPRHKEILLITDLQRFAWDEASVGDVELREIVQRLSRVSRFVLYDVGRDQVSQVTLTDLKATEPLVTPTTEVHLRATLKASGTSAPVQRQVELWVDGQVQAQQSVTLPPNQETAIVFNQRFAQGGFRRIRVQATADALPIDDQRMLALQVRPRLRILCVNGKPTGEPRESAAYHLKLALSPVGASKDDGWIEPVEVSAADWGTADLSTYDAVFFCNVAEFLPAEVPILQTYLQGGGVVVWGMGDRVQAAPYNERLATRELCLLPAPIGGREGDSRRKQPLRTLSPLDFTHPILKVFQGNPSAGLTTAPVYEYFRVTAPPEGVTPSRVVLGLDNGAPLILERPVGRGMSYLVTTALDESWGNWTLWPCFLPLMQELVTHSVASVSTPTSQLVQGNLDIRRQGDGTLKIVRPDGASEALEFSVANQPPLLSYGKTELPGFYSVQNSSNEETGLFAVNVDPREGDVTRIPKAALMQGVFADVPCDTFTEFHGLKRIREREETAATEPAGWMLLIGLWLLFVELVLSWNFRYGVCLLFPPVIPWMLRSGR